RILDPQQVVENPGVLRIGHPAADPVGVGVAVEGVGTPGKALVLGGGHHASGRLVGVRTGMPARAASCRASVVRRAATRSHAEAIPMLRPLARHAGQQSIAIEIAMMTASRTPGVRRMALASSWSTTWTRGAPLD